MQAHCQEQPICDCEPGRAAYMETCFLRARSHEVQGVIEMLCSLTSASFLMPARCMLFSQTCHPDESINFSYVENQQLTVLLDQWTGLALPGGSAQQRPLQVVRKTGQQQPEYIYLCSGR